MQGEKSVKGFAPARRMFTTPIHWSRWNVVWLLGYAKFHVNWCI